MLSDDEAQIPQKQARANNGMQEFHPFNDAKRDLKAQWLDMNRMTAQLSQLADAPKAVLRNSFWPSVSESSL